MCHMQRIRKKLRSTRKEVPLYLQNLETEGINIDQEQKCGEVYLMGLDIRRMNGTIYTDLTGAFPVTSARGNKLLYIAYSYDTNGILWEPMKSKTTVKCQGYSKQCMKTGEERNKTKTPYYG